MNVASASTDKIMANEEIKSITEALGCGIFRCREIFRMSNGRLYRRRMKTAEDGVDKKMPYDTRR